LIEYFEHDEIRAILDSVDRRSSQGSRDYALLALMFNTGARVQEIVDLGVSDLQLQPPAQVKLVGKGRKTRICPLWPQTARVLRGFCESSLRSEAWTRDHRRRSFAINEVSD
jgi:integrase/recombinase XerD